MANDVDAVEKLLEELRSAAMPAAKNELKEIKDCSHKAIKSKVIESQ